jgi:hypothetical protein
LWFGAIFASSRGAAAVRRNQPTCNLRIVITHYPSSQPLRGIFDMKFHIDIRLIFQYFEFPSIQVIIVPFF